MTRLGDRPVQAPTSSAGVADSPAAEARDAYVTVLFNRYRGALHRYLARFVAPDEVPDLVQETYFRLLRHESLVQIDALARGLLFQTATNLARDHRRRRASRHEPFHDAIDDSHMADLAEGPEEGLVGQQTLQVLERALANLPVDTRRVFVLSRFRDMSYPKIADALGLSTRTVARKMAEALDVLAIAVRSTQ